MIDLRNPLLPVPDEQDRHRLFNSLSHYVLTYMLEQHAYHRNVSWLTSLTRAGIMRCPKVDPYTKEDRWQDWTQWACRLKAMCSFIDHIAPQSQLDQILDEEGQMATQARDVLTMKVNDDFRDWFLEATLDMIDDLNGANGVAQIPTDDCKTEIAWWACCACAIDASEALSAWLRQFPFAHRVEIGSTFLPEVLQTPIKNPKQVVVGALFFSYYLSSVRCLEVVLHHDKSMPFCISSNQEIDFPSFLDVYSLSVEPFKDKLHCTQETYQWTMHFLLNASNHSDLVADIAKSVLFVARTGVPARAVVFFRMGFYENHMEEALFYSMAHPSSSFLLALLERYDWTQSAKILHRCLTDPVRRLEKQKPFFVFGEDEDKDLGKEVKENLLVFVRRGVQKGHAETMLMVKGKPRQSILFAAIKADIWPIVQVFFEHGNASPHTLHELDPTLDYPSVLDMAKQTSDVLAYQVATWATAQKSRQLLEELA